MNIKDNKGVTGVDVAVAIVVIIVFLSIITAMFYNVSTSSKNISRKAEATHIAVDVIEKMKQAEFGDLEVTGETRQKLSETSIPTLTDYTVANPYDVEITVEDYKDGNAVKIITAYVTYKVNKKDEEVKIQTLKKSDESVTEEAKEYTAFEFIGKVCQYNTSTSKYNQLSGGEFKFEVVNTDSNSQSTGEIFTNEASDTSSTPWLYANVKFKVNLTGTGDHKFQVAQIKGTTTGMEYDDSFYTINIVTKLDSNGKIVMDTIDAEINGGSVDAITFFNEYNSGSTVVPTP